MVQKIRVRPLRWFERLADTFLVPIMYVISGTFREVPQQGHVWNRHLLQEKDLAYLDPEKMVYFKGTTNEGPRKYFGFSAVHFPRSGWRKYVVLAPTVETPTGWHVGWKWKSSIGVRRHLLHGFVRMVAEHDDVDFFGVTPEGDQVPLVQVAVGMIGDGGEYKNILLL